MIRYIKGQSGGLQAPVFLLGSILAIPLAYGIGHVRYGFSLQEGWVRIGMLLLLGFISYIDYLHKLIPNECILLGLIVSGVRLLTDIFLCSGDYETILLNSFAGGLLWGGLFMTLSLVMHQAVGMGDAKMLFVIGTVFGPWKTFSYLFLSFILMSFVGLILLFLGKASGKSTLPMAPFIFLSFLIGTAFGV